MFIILEELLLTDVAQFVAELTPKWRYHPGISRGFRSENGLRSM
jgi:hypothetical protein